LALNTTSSQTFQPSEFVKETPKKVIQKQKKKKNVIEEIRKKSSQFTFSPSLKYFALSQTPTQQFHANIDNVDDLKHVHIIGKVKPHGFALLHQNNLYLCNPWRVFETVFYQDLLPTYFLDITPLSPPITITKKDLKHASLGRSEDAISACWELLLRRDPETVEALYANGFEWTAKKKKEIVISGINKSIPNYGISDMADILFMIHEKRELGTQYFHGSIPRPINVIGFLKGLAKEKAKEENVEGLRKSGLRNLLDKLKSTTTPEGKPLFRSFYEIKMEESQGEESNVDQLSIA